MRKIEGTCPPQYARVREQFEKHFADGLETGAAFAVMKDGETFVDLRGGFADAAETRPWMPDTLVNVWSCTKGVAALCCAMLVERGELAYSTPVAHHWPEFAAGGKEKITVAQVLSHQAGLPVLREKTALADFGDQELMASRLAAQEPMWEPGTANGYHAYTFGFLVAELVKRITGKSFGRFLHEEVTSPWDLDFIVGLPESEEGRVAEIIPDTPPDIPAPSPKDELHYLGMTNPFVPQSAPNDRSWRAAEIPAANGHGTAASLARFYSGLALGGTLDGTRLISPAAIDTMRTRQVPKDRNDLVFNFPAPWGLGVVSDMFVTEGAAPGSFGHTGRGGSFAMADPENGLGIAYVMNRMSADMPGDTRGLDLMKAVYASL